MARHVKLNEKLWLDTLKLSTASLYHPFVLKLAQGTLPTDVFENFINQDEYFLHSMEECLSILERQCSENDSETGRLIKELKSSSSSELELHDNVLEAKPSGITLNNGTRNYTENLKDIALLEGNQGFLAAAMTPCPVLYKNIGKKLSVSSPFKSDPGFNKYFQNWIELYSSDTFQRSSEIHEAILNKLGSGLPYKRLLHYYQQSMVLEYMFFDAYNVTNDTCLPLCERFGNRKILLVLDFDKTLTVSDSCDLIGKTAVKVNGNGLSQWNQVVADYYSGYKTIEKDLNSAVNICEYSHILNRYENQAKHSLIKTGILSGLSSQHLNSIAQCVGLCEGAAEVLKKSSMKQDLEVKVLSSNWSSVLIKAVLSLNAGINTDDIEIISDDLDFGPDGLTTGSIDGSVCGPFDKERQIKALTGDHMTVYVGDSVLDILALIAADIGIIIGNDANVLNLCQRFGILVLPLVSYIIDSECQKNHGCEVLFKADSFFEIIAFIYGIPEDDIFFSKYTENHSPKVLTVGGSDSSGCSGIQADLKTFEAHSVFGMSALTSVTAQNTKRVIEVNHVNPLTLRKQITCVINDIGTDVLKTGMIPTPESVSAIAKAIIDSGVRDVVVDPVIKSSTGTFLMSDDTIEAIVTQLFPLSSIVTPNTDEASVILDGKAITNIEEMKDAAREISLLGPDWVLIKGGHLKSFQGVISDILYDKINNRFYKFSNPYISTKNVRGTGCTLASAIAANLAKNMSITDAILAANKYLHESIKWSVDIDLGGGFHGPIFHSFNRKEMRTKIESSLALYLVTDDLMIEGRSLKLEEAIERGILGGVSFVQIRCKDVSTDVLCSKVRQVLPVCRKHNVPLVVNDRVDVVMISNSDGLHIGQSDMKLEDARRLLGPRKIIGVSVSTPEEAKVAERNGADYLGVGTVFPTATKADVSAIIGLDGLQKITNAVSIPTVAIGGVNERNAGEVMNCNVSGIAIVSAILKADSIEASARKLRHLVNNVTSSRSPCSEMEANTRTTKNLRFSVVIDDSLLDIKQLDAHEVCKKVQHCGLSSVQLKCISMDGLEYVKLVKQFTDACKSVGISLSVRDRLDVAIIAESEGIHFGKDSIIAAHAARSKTSEQVIGVDVTCKEECVEAESCGVSYVTFVCDSVIPWGDLSEICKSVRIPVFASGQISLEIVPQLLSCGVSGITVPLELLDHDITNTLNLF